MRQRENSTWEPEWEEVEETPREARRRRRGRLPESTRLFIMAVAFWLAACLLLVLGWIGGNGGSDAAVLGFLLVCLVIAAICSAFAVFLALFGLFRFRRWKVWNLVLMLVAVLTNPLLLVFLVVRGLTMGGA